jgi:hypothetical protein
MILYQSKSFKIIQNHSKSFKIIQNHSKSFKIIQNHSKTAINRLKTAVNRSISIYDGIGMASRQITLANERTNERKNLQKSGTNNLTLTLM